MTLRRNALLACAFGVALAAAPAGAAAPGGAVLGGGGELFSIEHGTYGELMGRPLAPEADHPILALKVRRADQPEELLPLPATLGDDVESTATMLYEETSGTLFVAWESRHNVHSRVRLVGFSDGVWGDPVDVSDFRFSLKSDPDLAVTRDSFEGLDDEGEPVAVRRTVLHVVWVEDRAEGLAVVYSPLVLLDGTLAEPGPIYALTDLIAPTEEERLEAPLGELPLPAVVQAGDDGHSVIVGFVHPASGRLVTVDLALLSGDISSLADVVRAHVIQTGSRFDTDRPGELESLAGGTRAHVIQTGSRLDSELLTFIADGVYSHILEVGADFDLQRPGDVQSLGGVVRAHVIQTGRRLEERGLRLESASAPVVLDFGGGESAISHQVGLGTVSVRSLEGLEFGAEPMVLLSPDGADALIAWEQDGQLRYQESRGEGWSDVRAMSLSTIDRVRALEIVEHRIRNR